MYSPHKIWSYNMNSDLKVIWFTYAWLVLFLGYSIFWHISRLIYFFKCIKIRKCFKKECRNKKWCDKHCLKWTKEDIDKLQDLIEHL